MRLWLLLLLASSACVSANERLVAKVSATTTYRVATYEHRCQNTGNPPQACTRCQAVINEAVWLAKVAETNKQQGYLTPAEKYELEQLVLDLETCP